MCQLDILNQTADILKSRRDLLIKRLSTDRSEFCAQKNKAKRRFSDNPTLLLKLQRELRAVERQVDSWIRELVEISSDRTKLTVGAQFSSAAFKSH